jgi:hypothetical protein
MLVKAPAQRVAFFFFKVFTGYFLILLCSAGG